MDNDPSKTYNVWKLTFIKFSLKTHFNPNSNTCKPIMFMQMCASQID
jgi:hypothetical protein